MGPRFAKAAFCLLSVVVLCLVAAPPAHAGSAWDKFMEELSRRSEATEQAWSEFEGTEEYRWLMSEADALAARIVALPDEVTGADRGEVREIRREFDSLDIKVSRCSFNQLAANDDNIDSRDVGYFLFVAGCEDAEQRIARAEGQLETLDSENSSGEDANGNAGKGDGWIEGILANGQLPPWALVVGLVWYAVIVLQSFLAYGTAYRKAKAGGDSGVSLFGWLLVYNLAAIVPGLGVFLWKKSKG